MKKGFLYISIANLTFMFAGYATNIVLGRSLGPSLYGSYGVLTSMMTALNIMLVSGAPQVVSRLVAGKRSPKDAILQSALIVQGFIALTMSVIFIIASPVAAYVFHDHRFIIYMCCMALIFPLYGYYALYAGYYNGLKKFRKQAVSNIVYSLSKLVMVVTLGLLFSLYGVIVGFLISPLIALVSIFHIPKKSKRPVALRQLYSQSFPLVTYSVLSTLLISVDLFSVKALAPSAVAGYYSAAQNIALITLLSLSAIGQVMFPLLAALKETGAEEDIRKSVDNAFRYLLLLVLPLAAFLSGGAKQIIAILYGSNYAPAATYVRILVISYIAITILSLASNILNAIGKTKVSIWGGVSALVVTTSLCITLVPPLGAVGAAEGVGAGGIVGVAITVRALLKAGLIRIDVRTLLRALLGSILIFALLNWSKYPVWIAPLYWIILALAYAVWLHVSQAFPPEEAKKIAYALKFLRSLLTQKRVTNSIATVFCLLILTYIAIANTTPFNLTTFFTINRADASDQFKPISRVELTQTTTELEDGLVYVNTPSRLKYDKASIVLKFRNTDPDQVLSFGYKDSTGYQYNTKIVDAPFLDGLNWSRISNGTTTLYQKVPKYGSISEFENNLPKNSTIGTFNFADNALTQVNDQMSGYSPSSSDTDLNTPLRGKLVMYAYLQKEPFSMTITKRDLHWYSGIDTTSVSIYKDGSKVYSTSISDNSDTTDDHKLSKPQTITIHNPSPNLPESGVYEIVVNESDDSIVTDISTNLHKIVFQGPLDPASGSVYGLDGNTSKPTVLYSNGARFSAQTYHTSSLQSLAINSESVPITQIKTPVAFTSNTTTSSIILPKSDVILNSDGFFAFSPNQLFEPLMYHTINITNSHDTAFADYIIADYVPPKKGANGLLTSNLSFSIINGYSQNDLLNWQIGAPDVQELNPKPQIQSITFDLFKIGWLDK